MKTGGFFMSIYQKEQLLNVILRIFPNAVVVERRPRNPQPSIFASDGGLAEHAKPLRAVSRARKPKFRDPDQLSLFDDGGFVQ
jgi:hypothetical protein